MPKPLSVDGERDDIIAALEVDLRISAGTDHNVLLTVDRIG
jgi:hypothetical protein